MLIKVPDQGFFEAPRMSFSPMVDFTGGTYNEDVVRRQLQAAKERMNIGYADRLADWGRRISGSVEEIFEQSQDLALEASKAM